MDGFFSKKQTESKSRPDGKVYSCTACGLFKKADTPKMKPTGEFKKGILNIGPFPTTLDDERGKHWQGKEGRLLKKIYREIGFDLEEDCLNVNAVNCWTDKPPMLHHIDCCRSVVVSKVLEEYKPKVIVLFGEEAIKSFLGHRWKKDLRGIETWRGWMIPDQDHRAWVLPVFDPAYVVKSDKQVETIFRQDLQRIKDAVETTFPREREPNITYLENLEKLALLKSSAVAFDYETTGLKPHAPGHRIICASLATVDETFAFMLPKTRKELKPFLNILSDNSISKMAHNMKYEHIWTQVRLRTEVRNWGWDSMLAAHLLDNRPFITGLKFQTYINFGVVDYASDVSTYLQSSEKGGNSINRISQLLEKPGGEKILLKYCGLDSYYERKLAMKQIELIGYDFLPF